MKVNTLDAILNLALRETGPKECTMGRRHKPSLFLPIAHAHMHHKNRRGKRHAPTSKVGWLVMRSDEAYRHIHELLDFCIDANHDYLCPHEDLKNYYLLAKPKGIIRVHRVAFSEVIKSANKFAPEKALTLHIVMPVKS